MSSKIDGSQVASIDYGTCLEISPCKHEDVVITLKNGQVITFKDHFSALEMRKLLKKMPAEKVSDWAREHFMTLEPVSPPTRRSQRIAEAEAKKKASS